MFNETPILAVFCLLAQAGVPPDQTVSILGPVLNTGVIGALLVWLLAKDGPRKEAIERAITQQTIETKAAIAAQTLATTSAIAAQSRALLLLSFALAEKNGNGTMMKEAEQMIQKIDEEEEKKK